MRTSIKAVIAFSLSVLSCNFAPGSYPYAEEYEINLPEKELIKSIEKFKEENPEYVVPDSVPLKDGRSTKEDHWYDIYFFYKKENAIVHAWTRPSEKGKTTLAFVSLNYGLTLGNWKVINKDFTKAENSNQKKLFEERILNKINSNAP